jgi:hypothetical protein
LKESNNPANLFYKLSTLPTFALEVCPNQGFQTRAWKMARVVARRRIRHARQSTLLYQVFVCFLPRWDRIAGRSPVSIRCLVTPFHQTWHNFRVPSGAAKRLHCPVGVPYRQGPERAPRVDKKPSAGESRSAHDLALRKKGLPQERRKIPQRANAKTRDGSEHGLHIVGQREFGPDGERLFWRSEPASSDSSISA